MCADSPEELEGIIMWYILLCPHESATRYCVYVHKNVQYSTHYKNFFSYESCPSLTARINMSVPTEKKRSYVGKTRMSRMGFQVMSRMPHFYELMKDKDYRREYDALIQERELVDSKHSVQKNEDSKIPGLDYKKYAFNNAIYEYMKNSERRKDVVSLYMRSYSRISGSRVSVKKKQGKFENDPEIYDHLIDMIGGNGFKKQLDYSGFSEVEIAVLVTHILQLRFVSVTYKMFIMFGIFHVFMSSIVLYIEQQLGIVVKDFSIFFLMKDGLEYDVPTRTALYGIMGFKPTRKTDLFCVPSYSQMQKILEI